MKLKSVVYFILPFVIVVIGLLADGAITSYGLSITDEDGRPVFRELNENFNLLYSISLFYLSLLFLSIFEIWDKRTRHVKLVFSFVSFYGFLHNVFLISGLI